MTQEKKMRRLAAKLLREGRMPSISELAAAILEVRKAYANKIRRARREEKLSR